MDLKKIIGKFTVHPIVRGRKLRKITARAPGMKYRHYAPNVMIILVEGKYKKVRRKIRELIKKYKKEGNKVGVMTTNKNYSYRADAVKFIGDEPELIAKNLFKTFREFDKEKIDVVMAEGIFDIGLGLAVMNRLRKASRRIIEV